MSQKASLAEAISRYTSILSAEYGDPFLNNQKDPIDELVFLLLSEKTDEAKYLAAFIRLKERFPNWNEVLTVAPSEIARVIRISGMAKRRSILLQRLLRAISNRFGKLDLSRIQFMSPEEAEKELLMLPGVGPKAARCVLLYCFNVPVLPVDIHTYRLAIRLGILSRRVSYELSHTALARLIPPKLRFRFHINAVAHGRSRCSAIKPICGDCPLADFCSVPKALKTLPVGVRPTPIAIDLFAGAGGMSLGFEKAGFRVVQAVELSTRSSATFQNNNPDVDIVVDNITNLDPLACLARLGLRSGDITCLIGGIPCQGFSESNRRTRNSDNPRNHLYKEFIRFLNLIKPAWFVIENVAGLRTMEKGLILRKIIADCKALGYDVECKELNAADFGVPQLRRRIFIVGNNLGLPIKWPSPTHGPGRAPYVTVSQAISDLPRLRNGSQIDFLPYGKSGRALTKYQRVMRQPKNGANDVQGNFVSRNAPIIVNRYRHIGPGKNWEAIPEELMDNYDDTSRCHTGIYHRIRWGKPSKVIGNFRKNMLIHPQQHRGLSVREAARLQSFPDDYEFVGSIGFQQQQVADAVPPLLAEAVATSILSSTLRVRQKHNRF